MPTDHVMHSAQPSSSNLLTHTDPHIAHSYGTRIRQNIIIKPSARLRNSPDPPIQLRKPKITAIPKTQQTAYANFPQFPPSGIVLHPDDANSKVFLAIGRSFLSVDNRAMTIKDLAEMTVNFGLVCQNVSAASQAITTYIRTHMVRCDAQDDQPLLLRHTLSGTASDDDLLPALHSRSGGAHCNISPENRATNFRRGTMVWYLSRSTGAPCPFARAGIRLCDYGEDGKTGNLSISKEKKRQRDRERRVEQQCGQKRKRPLRGCVAKGSESDSQNEEERPPPKVKLTLRLKPLLRKSPSSDPTSSGSRRIIDISKESDSDSDDSMSVDSSDDEAAGTAPTPAVEEIPWSLPPYPRRSLSIPCYTPCTDGPYPSFPSPITEDDHYRRSPSITYSVGSPPPDSEDEDDDFHITMTGARRHSTAPRPAKSDPDNDWDADLDSEGDGETMWESPGPRSPSAPTLLPDIVVKEEPTDVQGMLEAWEDFDCTVAGAKVVEVIAQAAASVLEAESPSNVKVEGLDMWSWESNYTDPNQDWCLPHEGGLTARVKQEDIDLDSQYFGSSLHDDFVPQCIGSSSPVSPISQLSHFSDSPSPESSRDENDWHDSGKQYATIRSHAKTMPNAFPFFPTPTPNPSLSFTLPLTPQHDSPWPSKSLPELTSPSNSSISHSLATLIQSMSMNSPTTAVPSAFIMPPPCISPQETRCKGTSSSDIVVVHTCQPCTPAISATQIEGISVYQMTLGSFSLLRRIDTDFVNLSPIVAYSGAPYPVLSTIPNATTVTKGSSRVSGTWVPLAAAQAYVRDHHPLRDGPLDIFLSDVLFERFPTALQDFHRSSTPGRMFNHFGPHFGSTLQATQLCSQADGQGSSWDGWSSQEEPHPLPLNNPFALSIALSAERSLDDADLPLNETEREIFHELCDIPEWDKENVTPPSPKSTATGEKAASAVHEEPPVVDEPAVYAPDGDRSDRPLRRSKRVADAMAAQSHSRTRSRRGGSRNSLS